MKHNDNSLGFEFLCRAIDCVNNDRPVCTVHSERSPVIIGLHGRCLRYKKAESSDVSEDKGNGA